MGAMVTLSPITDKSPEFIASKVKNKVEYTTPSKNSYYVQSDFNSIIIHYYEEVEVETPEPKPDEGGEKEEPPETDGEEG